MFINLWGTRVVKRLSLILFIVLGCLIFLFAAGWGRAWFPIGKKDTPNTLSSYQKKNPTQKDNFFKVQDRTVSGPAAESQVQPSQNQPARLPQPAPAVNTVHPVTQAVVNSGMLSCASRVNQVSNFLTNGTDNGALVFLNPGQAADQGVFSVSYEANRPQGSTMYASAAFAAGSAGCPAVYETVEYGRAACADIQRQLFSQLQVTGKMKNHITILEGGALKIFLMPAGDGGCVVIKKEVVQ